jgi:hypothetical protein
MKNTGSVKIIMDPGRPKTYDLDPEHFWDSPIELAKFKDTGSLSSKYGLKYLAFTSLLPPLPVLSV